MPTEDVMKSSPADAAAKARAVEKEEAIKREQVKREEAIARMKALASPPCDECGVSVFPGWEDNHRAWHDKVRGLLIRFGIEPGVVNASPGTQTGLVDKGA